MMSGSDQAVTPTAIGTEPVESGQSTGREYSRGNTPFQGLTALRGIAAWWVVFYHFREFLPLGPSSPLMILIANGYLAVDFFFALSGFVLALNYSRRLCHGSIASAVRFVGLRLARIYPMHAIMLLLFLLNPVAIAVFSQAGAIGPEYSLSYFLLSIPLLQCWGFSDRLAWNIPAWSISTEFAAYLVFPLIAVCWSRIGTTAARSFALIIVLVFALAAAACNNGGLNADIPHFGLPRCLLEFGAGCALFQLATYTVQASERRSLALTAASVLLLLAAIVHAAPDWAVAPPAMLMLLYAVQSRPRWSAWLLERRVLIWLGEVSYSTYMIHYFVKEWIKFIMVRQTVPDVAIFGFYVVLVVAGSKLLHRFVEIPAQIALRRHIGALPA